MNQVQLDTVWVYIGQEWVGLDATHPMTVAFSDYMAQMEARDRLAAARRFWTASDTQDPQTPQEPS